jgi:hypothetical protein
MDACCVHVSLGAGWIVGPQEDMNNKNTTISKEGFFMEKIL